MEDIKQIDDSTKMAVVVHLYYRDLWNEIKHHLTNIPIEFDLFISICDTFDGVKYTTKKNTEIKKEIKNSFPNVKIKIFPNLGRDVAPFLEIINKMNLKTYDVILKIHSKKSKNLGVTGDLWRIQMITSLIKDKYTATQNIKEMLKEDIGILGCGHNLNRTDIGNNKSKLYELYDILDIDKTKRKLEFFSGTMFFIKPIVLKKLKNKFTINDFVENGALDGNLEHAIERVFINLCRDAGYDIRYNYSNVKTGLPFQNHHVNNPSSILYKLVPPDFDWKIYLEINDDLIEAGINDETKAIYHWHKYGKSEGRQYL